MTAPTGPRLQRRNYGSGHGYLLDGKKIDGVTTVIGDGLPKPALINWAAVTTAEAAVDQWEELSQLGPATRLKRLKRARFEVVKEASMRGTEIHTLGDKLSRGEEVDAGKHLGEVEAYARFLDEWDVEILATEAPCASTRYMYAGTLDSIAIIRGLALVPEYAHLSEAAVLLDLKTGRGVYNDTSLQLVAYGESDIWQPNGPESEEPMPEIGGLFIAHILPDAVRLIPVLGDRAALLTQFRYLQMTKRWVDESKDLPLLGAPLKMEGTS